MRIAIVGYNSPPTNTDLGTRKAGGQSLNIYYMIKHYRQLGIEPVYVDGANDKDTDKPTALLDYPAISRFSDQISAMLPESQVHLVHTCGVFSGQAFLLARESNVGLRDLPWVHSNFATLSQRKFSAYGQSLDELRSDEAYQLERQVNQAAPFIITGSEHEVKELNQLFGVESKRVAVIYRGIDHAIFFPRGYRRSIDIVSCGRMAPIKDFPFLIESIYCLMNHSPTLLRPKGAVIIGGSEEERIKLGLPELVAKYRLSDFIQFQDAISHTRLAEFLNQARVFAGTSRHETFGLLPVEARACGTPTILRNNSSYPEIPGAQSGGIISSNVSPDLFALDMARLLSLDLQQWQRYSDSAVADSEQFSWEIYAQRHRVVYEYLVGVRHAHSPDNSVQSA